MKKEIYERVEELLTELRELALSGVPVIVEGRRDKEALRKLEVKGKIFCISGRKGSLLNFLESLSAYPRVLILTDFDRSGDELAAYCAKHLRNMGSEPILLPRKKLKSLVRADVKGIQDLPKFLARYSREAERNS